MKINTQKKSFQTFSTFFPQNKTKLISIYQNNYLNMKKKNFSTAKDSVGFFKSEERHEYSILSLTTDYNKNPEELIKITTKHWLRAISNIDLLTIDIKHDLDVSLIE